MSEEESIAARDAAAVPPEGSAQTGPTEPDPAVILDDLPAKIEALRAAVGEVVIGQDRALAAMFYALLTRGHCLLVGVPGVGKTLLVRAFGRALDLPFSRIQFTPDLMPADITGTEILHENRETGLRTFDFSRGPIFTCLLLADEINRTPPKTQAALLEAMQERTVTAGGEMHRLDEPFTVVATQNPIEQEGTYPLPEAQLDRFLFEIPIGYPDLDDERIVVAQHSYAPTERVQPVFDRDEILRLRDAVAAIPAAPNVIDYAVRLVRATRPDDPTAPDFVKRWLRWGASPRASQNLILAARARAACQGRFNVSVSDVRTLAPWVLRHRLIRSFRAEADGESPDSIVERISDEVAD